MTKICLADGRMGYYGVTVLRRALQYYEEQLKMPTELRQSINKELLPVLEAAEHYTTIDLNPSLKDTVDRLFEEVCE